MYLPKLPASPARYRREISQWGGVHYGESGSSGELSESKNLTARKYPALSSRPGRSLEASYENGSALYAGNKLLAVNGTELIYGGEVVGTVSEGTKQFAAVSGKIAIWPDKIAYSTVTGETEQLVDEVQCRSYALSFTASFLTLRSSGYYAKKSGTGYTDYEYEWAYEENWFDNDGDGVEEYFGYTDYWWEEPRPYSYGSARIKADTGAATLAGGEYPGSNVVKLETYYKGRWLKGSGENIRRITGLETIGDPSYTDSTSSQGGVVTPPEQVVLRVHWVEYAPTEYTNAPLSESFQTGDLLVISDCISLPANNISLLVRGVSDDGYTLTFDENSLAAGTETGGAEFADCSLSRNAPNLKYICSHGNRMWGTAENTIYGSALGDVRSFYVYDGLSTDSYTVTVDTPGEFTGCISYSSGALFWKEDLLYKLLGSAPDSYALYKYTVPGLQAGCSKSMVIINEVLYYKGIDGIYAYSGGTPVCIGENFGTRRFDSAVAGADGERYVISMRDTESGEWGIWVYDTLQGIWLREDDTQVMDFAVLDSELYFMSAAGEVYHCGSGDEDVEWEAELYPWRDGFPELRQYRRLFLRLELAAGTSCRIKLSYDGGPWQKVWEYSSTVDAVKVCSIAPRRCSELRVKISGSGAVLLREFAREYDERSWR